MYNTVGVQSSQTNIDKCVNSDAGAHKDDVNTHHNIIGTIDSSRVNLYHDISINSADACNDIGSNMLVHDVNGHNIDGLTHKGSHRYKIDGKVTNNDDINRQHSIYRTIDKTENEYVFKDIVDDDETNDAKHINIVVKSINTSIDDASKHLNTGTTRYINDSTTNYIYRKNYIVGTIDGDSSNKARPTNDGANITYTSEGDIDGDNINLSSSKRNINSMY